VVRTHLFTSEYFTRQSVAESRHPVYILIRLLDPGLRDDGLTR